MTAAYRLAADLCPAKNLMGVAAESQFQREIRNLFARIRPRRLIETGTYLGTGSTAIIASALRDLGLSDSVFYTIECNPVHFRKAQVNLTKNGYTNVRQLRGLSLPRRLLPSVRQLEQAYVKTVEADGIYVDFAESERAALYHRETDYPDADEDLLGRCLDEFDNRPDFLLLDSGGHLGWAEFGYVVRRLAGPCHLALDDINHVKHHRSCRHILGDKRFEVLTRSDEKFGFCIARFTPGGAA